MTTHFYEMDILREGKPVGTPMGVQAPLRQGIEALRWRRFCRGEMGFDPTEVEILPRWNPGGPPLVESIAFSTLDGEDTVELNARRFYFALAQKASSRLVEERILEEGEAYDYIVRARRHEGKNQPPAPLLRYAVDESVERPAATSRHDPEWESPADCFEVVIDSAVLAGARAMARKAGEHETGGFLFGHLGRGAAGSAPFLHLTAVVADESGRGGRTSFAFTPDSWNRGREALGARARNEVFAGWFHNHPDLCNPECDPELRAACALRKPFLSADDFLVHQTAFPGPHNVALLVSDNGTCLETSLWAWRDGFIARRSYHSTP